MLPIKKGVDASSLPNIRNGVQTPGSKNGAHPPGSKAGDPAAAAASSAEQAKLAATVNNPARKGSEGSSASTSSRAAGSKPQTKSKTSASSFESAKKAARRDAHTGHAMVAPFERERGGSGSGSFHHNGKSDIQDWVPFSAQQSRILRTARAIPAAKAVSHSVLPLKATVFAMASRIYSEVLPALFRMTPRDMQRKRDIRKAELRKELAEKQVQNEARREMIRKRAESKPNRVMAGNLTTAFATT